MLEGVGRIIIIIFRRSIHLISFLFGEGSWRLKIHEKIIIDAVLDHLGGSEKSMVYQQLMKPYFVDRVSKRISVVRFYKKDTSLRLPVDRFSDVLFNVKLSVNGKSEVSKLTFYEGFIFSVELKKPRNHYKNANVRVIEVKKGDPMTSYTAEIDRLEHGSE